MLEIGFGLIEGTNGELLRHATATKPGDLRKDEPDPVTRLSPSTEFSEDCVVGGLLCVEKAVEIVNVGHGTCL
jgi:hypothetical protein